MEGGKVMPYIIKIVGDVIMIIIGLIAFFNIIKLEARLLTQKGDLLNLQKEFEHTKKEIEETKKFIKEHTDK